MDEKDLNKSRGNKLTREQDLKGKERNGANEIEGSTVCF